MTDRTVPDAVRKQVEAMVSLLMARCEQHGVAWADCFAAMQAESKLAPTVPPDELCRRAWERVKRGAN